MALQGISETDWSQLDRLNLPLESYSMQSVTNIEEYTSIMPGDRNNIVVIGDIILMQSILVMIGAASILLCTWSPDQAQMDYDKLARVMYLFDSQACGYKLQMSKKLHTVHFSNDTKNYNVRPIERKPARSIGATRLSEKTRMYIIISLSLHIIWFISTIVTRGFCKRSSNVVYLKIVLGVFFYSCVIMVVFDVSMAVVYISHIKQSLTKNMILRYSGWSTTLKLKSYEEFAGWLPIVASFCWIRGGVILFINIYCCRKIHRIRRKIKRREIKRKYENERYTTIPEAWPVLRSNRAIIFRRVE